MDSKHARLNDKTATGTSAREVREYSKLTTEEIRELSVWMENQSTNRNPDAVLPIPECYKGTMAYMLLKSMGIDRDDLLPWNIPQSIVDFYADVWFSSQQAQLRTRKLGDPLVDGLNKLSETMAPKYEKRGGRA